MTDRASRPPRRIACVRCRRSKKKCDHAIPTCGQCRRAGVECRQLRAAQATGEHVTIPLSEYQRLSAQANGGHVAASANAQSMQDQDPGSENRSTETWPVAGGSAIPPTPPSVGTGTRGNQPPTPDWDMAVPSSCSESLSTNNLEGFEHVPPPGETPGSLARLRQTWPLRTVNDQEDAFWQDLTVDATGLPAVVADSNGVLPPGVDANPTLDMTWNMELYANIYLAHIQRMYPFLCDESIRGWMRTCARGQKLDGPDKGFILRILCSIGAFMCSSFSDDCPHLKEAITLSKEAFNNFYAAAMLQEPYIRAQISLSKLVHAIYGPSPQRIHQALTSALQDCGKLLDEENRQQQSPSRQRSRYILLACHQLHEIVACGWDRPDDLPNSLDEKLSIYIDRLSVSQQGSIHLRPFYKLRRIQHKIRLFHDAAERWCLDREAKGRWKADIVQDVEDWKATLTPQSEDEETRDAPAGKTYKQKVYDYTICLLHEADPSSMQVEDVYALLAASSDACSKFRATQKTNKGVILKNWNALVYQFKVGILLLYCFWVTPVSLRTEAHDEARASVGDCSETLQSFARRWPSAAVYHDTFLCLAAQTPFDASAATWPWQFPPQEAAKLDLLVASLRGLRTHKNVLSIIETIGQWGSEQGDDNANLFMASNGLDPMNLFELGQGVFGDELFSFEM